MKPALVQTTSYRCTECGTLYARPTGRCSGCSRWNTVAPIIEGLSGTGLPVRLDKVGRVEDDKIRTGIEEFDRAFDGGLPRASAIVLGGQPGIGKSTCVLQLAGAFPKEIGRVLYVSAEEHASKIGGRADRLKVDLEKQENVTVLCEGDAERIINVATKEKSALIILDSVQTISFPGDVAGTLASAVTLSARFFQLAHAVGCVVILICHVTKDGDLAGPKKLEHFVDVVAEFDSDRTTDWRTLRTLKNRSGAAPRMGIFKMTEMGLIGVGNPAEAMLQTIDADASGWALGVQTDDEGRAWIVQAQALVGEEKDDDEEPSPGRLSCTGCSQGRVRQLLAVLEKRCNVSLTGRDLFVNVVGGSTEADPGLDLAIAAAILSASLDVAMLTDTCLVGEIGLFGEVIRPAGYDARCQLAERYGFDVMQTPTLRDLVQVATEAASE